MKISLVWFRLMAVLLALLVSPMAMSYTVDKTSTEITGLWWNANESGWGATLTHQYDVVFVTMFVYDSIGNPTWYVADNCAVAASGCTGGLYKVSGGSLPSGTWSSVNIAATPVGTISLVFTDKDTGSMNYTIDGVNGSKAITRQVFRNAPVAITPPSGFSLLSGSTTETVSLRLAACSGSGASSGINIMKMSISTSGGSAEMKLYDSNFYFVLHLQYSSGDKVTGFNLSGSGEETIGGSALDVKVSSLLNPNSNLAYFPFALDGFVEFTFPNGCKMTGSF